MGKIIELTQHVSNQIAAGEVVERISSVIKELVENSLDAGAHNIEIRIKNGGFLYAMVQDDGVGMDEADVRLAIKRYATSKLQTVSDLDRVQTFGFRGEALPSIASISHMSIISRQHEDSHGTKAVIEAGVIREISKAGASFGTRIEVRNLFFNVPARLKFVKSRRIETTQIDKLLRAFAFVHQNIGWKFFSDDNLIFSFKPEVGHSLERAYALLGKDKEGFLYPILKNTDFITIDGVIGAPMVQRRDTQSIVLFVNNRLVSDKKLTMAIKTAFRSLLEVGHNPVCALKLYIAPDEIDVNVHPRKAEIRFRDDRRVVANVIKELSDFLAKTPWLRSENVSSIPRENLSPIGLEGPYPKKGYNFDFLLDKDMPLSRDPPIYHPQKKLLSASQFSTLRIVGQVCSTYLLLESEEGLVVIDQHAAHERVMYEKIRKTLDQNASSSPLLVPITIDVEFAEMTLYEEYATELASIGIETEKFGENSIVIRTLPDFIKDIDIKSLMVDILSDLSLYGQTRTSDDLFHNLCATVACHSSIRAGQRLNKEEIESLFLALDELEFGAHCPHGRPIVKSIFASEMKKWFDRT